MGIGDWQAEEVCLASRTESRGLG